MKLKDMMAHIPSYRIILMICGLILIITYRGHGEVKSYEQIYPPLVRAVADGNIALATKLIDQGIDLNVRSFDGTSAVHFAVKNGDDTYSEKLLHILIDEGASVRLPNDNGYEPMLLTPYIADLDRRNRFIGELLMNGGRMNETSKLMENSTSGVVTGKRDTRRMALLEIMADNFDRQGVVQGLKVWGAVIQPNLIERARAYAFDKGFRDIAQVIVDYQRKPNTSVKGITPLMLAVLRNDEPAVIAFSKNRSMINALSQDRFKQTALHLALRQHNAKLATILVENGARVDIGDYLGNTPLHVLARINNSEVQRVCTPVLVGAGGNVGAQNNRGNTVLMEAIRLRDKGYAEYLINEYPQVVRMTVTNKANKNALDLSKQRGLAGITALIERNKPK